MDVPKSIRILTSGVNQTIKGAVLFDDVAQSQLGRSISDRGVKIPFDLEHLSLTAPSGSDDVPTNLKAKAWGEAVIRDGELWIDNITYTSQDVEDAVSRKELLYTSPVFDMDKNSRPVRLLSVAFTNTPAIHKTQPLTLSAGVFPQMDDVLQQILAAIAALSSKLDGMKPAEAAPPPPPPLDLACDKEPEKAVLSAVYRLTGKTDPQEAHGALLALSARAQTAVTSARSAQIDALIARGQATPADKSELLALSARAFAAFESSVGEARVQYSAPTTPTPATAKSQRQISKRLLDFAGVKETDLEVE